jgi:hypothetical protein
VVTQKKNQLKIFDREAVFAGKQCQKVELTDPFAFRAVLSGIACGELIILDRSRLRVIPVDLTGKNQTLKAFL